MVEMKEETSYWWWFDSHQHSSKRSQWLQSTLGDLDKKTKTMLKLIEEDADSFAQRAEMYYKKRPELISMVEDFYKTHRSLAERYDLLKSESASRLLTTLGSPFSAKCQQPKQMAGMGHFDQTYDSHSETGTTMSGCPFSTKYQQAKLMTGIDQFYQTYDSHSETGKMTLGYPYSTKYQQPKLTDGMDQFDQTYNSYSETGTYDTEDSAESEVDDPDQEDESVIQNEIREVQEPKHEVGNDENEIVVVVRNEEVMKLREEIGRLTEENRIQKDHLLQKDDEKREVIRQLSSALEVLKAENAYLRKSAARNTPKKKSLFEFKKWKDVFSGNLFNGSAKS